MEAALSSTRAQSKREQPHAVVTGASRGIGRATALALAKRGIGVTLVGRASANLDLCHRTVLETGAMVRVVVCDLASTTAIERCADEVLLWGPPLALVNNAGIVERSLLEALTLDSYHQQMNVNLLAPLWLTRCLLPAMKAAGRGNVVNVGSISATLGSAQQCVYNASKWALTGFTKSLAEELSDTGLMTVVVHPGAVETEMLRGSSYAPRMSAEDVARTLAFYSLDATPAHNGSVIEMFGV